ncbi:MAG: PaaI family thioesterase [Acidimicrobiales bacterium]
MADAGSGPGEIDEALTELAHTQMPLTGLLGLGIVGGGPDEIRARCSWAPERCTSGGVLHGGYLMAIADSVGAMVAVFNLPAGAITATIESKTNFLRGVTEGDLDIVATPVHVGRTTIVVQTDIARAADGKLVTRTTQTQAVIVPN